MSSSRNALLPFAVISISYLLFTVTDGAIRMIVLLHAYSGGFSALQVAVMFSLYELAGVVTNLVAGFAGAKLGIKCTLLTGLILQLVSYGMLFAWPAIFDDGGSAGSGAGCASRQNRLIGYVTVAQMFGGIAKDLVKLGGKTVTKLVTPAEKSTRLFKLVSLLTGWKNSLKGVGYFAGSALVAVQYELALAVMMGLIVVALPIATFGLDARLGTASKNNAKCSDVFITHNPNLNWLSLARCFLFASRDFWFEVPLPFFLRSPRCDGLGSAPCLIDSDCNGGAICLNMTAGSFDRVDSPLLSSPCAGPFSPVAAGDEGVAFTAASGAVCVNTNVGGGCGGLGWDRVVVGAILASYIIIYGQCQSYTPQLITGPLKQTPPNKLTETLWGCFNCIPTAVLAAVVYNFPSGSADAPLAAWLMAAIVCFALIFAVNSSIHSFLVVHYAKADKLATSVGFYYMSNAVGRLVGTLGSGVIYTYAGERYGALSGSDARAGLAACFVAGTISSVLAAVITLKIRDEAAGLRCGPCVCVAKEEQREESDAHGPPGTGTRPSAATTAAEVEQSQSSQSVSGDVVLVAGEGTASQC
jgi:hypothetical protein